MLLDGYKIYDIYDDHSNDDLVSVIGIIVLLLVLLLPFVMIAYNNRKYKKEVKKLDLDFDIHPTDIFKVEVVDKYTEIVREGSIKYPKSRLGFFISFKLESGKVRTYEVDEKWFRRIKNGAKGELAIVDGKFLGFSKKAKK